MTARTIKARRPVAWNALLRKGHAHDQGRSKTRRAARVDLGDALGEYEAELRDRRNSSGADDAPESAR